jgi:hypothetical protein
VAVEDGLIYLLTKCGAGILLTNIQYIAPGAIHVKSVFASWAPVLLLFKKIRKSYIFVSKKYENKSRHNK